MSKKAKAIASSDEAWRAREDAMTMARADEISKDPKRTKAAGVAAKAMLEEEKARLQGLQKVARKAK